MSKINVPKLIELYKTTFDKDRAEAKKVCTQWFYDLSQEDKNNFRDMHQKTNIQVVILSKLLRKYVNENPDSEYNTTILELLDAAYKEPPFEITYNYVCIAFIPSEKDKTSKLCVNGVICTKGRMWQMSGKKITPYWNIQPFLDDWGYDENIYEHIGRFKILKFFKDENEMMGFNMSTVQRPNKNS